MQILERNFRCRSGEIDIIARDGDYLVFVEVKYRRNVIRVVPLLRWECKSREKYAVWQIITGIPGMWRGIRKYATMW